MQADTQSLTESVTDYPVENGRTYHRYHEGGTFAVSRSIKLRTAWLIWCLAYLYPNDEQELDRLDMQHHMFKMVMEGRLFRVPLQNPERVLDIGTGSGIWPIEMGMLTHSHLKVLVSPS